jgi:hypothetical protein
MDRKVKGNFGIAISIKAQDRITKLPLSDPEPGEIDLLLRVR